MKYWLHRITCGKEISYSLLERGYLTLGWSACSKPGLLEAARKSEEAFEKKCEEVKIEKYRSRRTIRRFALFNPGDVVVVPLDGGKFSIYEVIEPAKLISEIKEEIGELKDKSVFWENGLLKKNSDTVDVGFVAKVKPIKTDLKRDEYADGALSARMKIQWTNGDIDDLEKNVQSVIDAKKPINFYKKALEDGAEILLKTMKECLTADKFERVVKTYMDTIGADYTYIPAKNESGKQGDADVIAYLNSLKVIILIQVKFHVGKTDEWAVEQIKKYKEQLEDSELPFTHGSEDNYNIIPWVISTCDEFEDRAKKEAEENNVRLINGKEFSKMLLNAGLAKAAKARPSE